ncbi:hypothetical protein Ancab_009292, partial [Ancistrocladus abbreviatus]
EEEQLEDPIANMKGIIYISETKNEILNMDSIIRDDATIVAENVINESLDPTCSSEEGDQSSDHRHESLQNKFEDLPMDKIVIKESSIIGKETQMAGIGSQMEKERVDDTKLLTFMRSSLSTVELVDVEDNEV